MKIKKDRDTSHLHRAWFASVWPASRTGKVLLAIFVTVGMFFAVVFYTTGKNRWSSSWAATIPSKSAPSVKG